MLNLREYLKEDRQWPRALRIAFAQRNFTFAQTPKEREFWRSVLAVNGVEV